MVELDAIPEEAKERVERAGPADLVIGLPACASGADAERMAAELREVVSTIAGVSNAVMVHPGDTTATNAAEEPAERDRCLRLLSYPMVLIDRFAEQKEPDPIRSVLLIGQQLGARACAVLYSAPDSRLPSDFRRLVQPVLEQNFDLAVPRYARRKFDSLINSGIVYPLTRALYGRRVQYPMATDLVFSSRFAERCLQPETRQSRPVPLVWVTNKAACSGFQIAQVNFGLLPPPPKDPGDLSTVLAQVLGSLFLDIEQNAVCWQKTRGSQPARTFGAPEAATEETSATDVRKMIETFQLGYRNLQEIWGLVLSPATLLELKRLTTMPADGFRMQDDLWVRLIYDFALAYRQRSLNRDHLLRAMTPLYLAWLASYALEVHDARAAQVEDRLERLCLAFETHKPLLVSRWRWPDRFNP